MNWNAKVSCHESWIPNTYGGFNFIRMCNFSRASNSQLTLHIFVRKKFLSKLPILQLSQWFFFISNIKIITRVRFLIQNFQTSLKFIILNPCSMFYDLYHSVELEIENLLYMRRNETQKLFHIFSTLSSITQLGCRFGNSQNMANSCMADSSKEWKVRWDFFFHSSL